MPNEIHRYYFGSQASPVAASNLEAGSYRFSGFAAEFSNYIQFNDGATEVTTALEGFVSVGVGDVTVTAETDGFTIEYVGALANTDVNPLSPDSVTLKQKADGISVTTTQNGVANVTVNPNNSTTTSPVSPVNEVQQVSLGGATTGTFDLYNGITAGTVSSLDAAGISAAMDIIWGSGYTSVTDLGSGNFSIEFISTYAAMDIPEMSVSSNGTDGSPSVSTTTDGVAGVSQVDTCTFDNTATAGSMLFDGQSLAYNADASTLSLAGASASGTPASGTITTTWSDFSNHMTFSVSADTLRIEGQPQIISVTLDDAPTEGTLNATLNGSPSSDFGYNDSSPASIGGWTGGGSAGAWTYTANVNAADVGASASEGSTPLRKACNVEVVTLQDGSSSGDTLTPDTIASVTEVVEPTIAVNALSISTPLVSCDATVIAPSVVQDGISVLTPEEIVAATTVVTADIVLGAITLTPDVIASTAVVVAPSTVLGTVTLTADELTVSSIAVTPTIKLGLYPASSFVGVSTTVVAPTVTATPVSRSPSNVITITTLVTAPTIVGGENTVSADDTWRRRSQRLARG